MDAKVSTNTKTKTFQNLNKNCPKTKTMPVQNHFRYSSLKTSYFLDNILKNCHCEWIVECQHPLSWFNTRSDSYFLLFGTILNEWYTNWSVTLSSDLSALDFWHSLVWNFEFDELDFFPSLNWIFTACVVYKNPVQTRKKIQFIKLETSNWRIWKIQFR